MAIGVVNSCLQYNYSHDNDGPGYLLFQYQDARPFTNNVVRFNISENDGLQHGYGGIHVGAYKNTIESLDIYHNTIYVSGKRSSGLSAINIPNQGIHGLKIINNLFVTDGLPVVNCSATNGVSFLANDYFVMHAQTNTCLIQWGVTNFNTILSWSSSTGQEQLKGEFKGMNIDPELEGPGQVGTISDFAQWEKLNGYKLKTISPVMGRGVILPVSVQYKQSVFDFFGGIYSSHNGSDIGAHQITGSNVN